MVPGLVKLSMSMDSFVQNGTGKEGSDADGEKMVVDICRCWSRVVDVLARSDGDAVSLSLFGTIFKHVGCGT